MTTIDIKSTVGSVYNLVETFGNALFSGPKSLTEASKPAILSHRVIIEDSLANNDIMLSLMSMLNQQVVGYVLNALQFGQIVDGSRTVRDVISSVSTESFIDSAELISFNGIPTEKIADRITLENYKNYKIKKDSISLKQVGVEGIAGSTRVVDMELKSSRLISTRVVEMDLRVDKDTVITVRLGVHLVPYFVSSEIMSTFLDLTNKSGTLLRWKKVLAGELRFFKDFVLCFDLIDKYANALKKDRKDQLGFLLKNNTNKTMKALAESFSKINPSSSNVASSILIIDKKTMDQNMSDSGTDLNDFIQRTKFFNNSLSLMVVVVDDIFNNVKIYYNGLKMFSTCTFAMLNRVGQKSDSYDLKDILTAFGSNQNLKY